MKTYVKPAMNCEVFAPNEFIAACGAYFVGCLREAGETDSYGGVHNQFSDGTGCLWYNNQVASLSDNDVVSIHETNAPDGQGTLYATNVQWNDSDSSGGLSSGDTITWDTQSGNGQKYAHTGKIYNANVS